MALATFPPLAPAGLPAQNICDVAGSGPPHPRWPRAPGMERAADAAQRGLEEPLRGSSSSVPLFRSSLGAGERRWRVPLPERVIGSGALHADRGAGGAAKELRARPQPRAAAAELGRAPGAGGGGQTPSAPQNPRPCSSPRLREGEELRLLLLQLRLPGLASIPVPGRRIPVGPEEPGSSAALGTRRSPGMVLVGSERSGAGPGPIPTPSRLLAAPEVLQSFPRAPRLWLRGVSGAGCSSCPNFCSGVAEPVLGRAAEAGEEFSSLDLHLPVRTARCGAVTGAGRGAGSSWGPGGFRTSCSSGIAHQGWNFAGSPGRCPARVPAASRVPSGRFPRGSSGCSPW